MFYYNWWYIVIIRFWVFDVSIFLIGSRLLDTLFLIDYWFRLSCTSLHQLLVHLFLIGQRIFDTLFWLINKFIFNARAWTRFLVHCTENVSATINSDVTLKLTSLHIHLISGSFIFESRRHVKIIFKSRIVLNFLNI